MKTTINRRVLTVVLSVVLLLQLLSIGISAETITTEETILQPLSEVVSLREPSSKQFEVADGQYVAFMYSDPVHFQNADGDWVEIDNSLKSVAFSPMVSTAAVLPALPTIGYYENTTNDFKVQIPAQFASYAPFKVTYGGHTLRFAMQDAAQASVMLPADEKAAVAAEKTALVEAARAAAQNGNAEQSKKLLTEAAGRLANQTATVAYKNILPGVSATYRVGSRSFKETLIFSRIPEQSSFSFNFTYTGLTPALQEDNSVHFYAADEEEPVFVIASPYMADAADGFSRNISVTVTPTASGCTYTLTPDAAWLADPARVYPVELDPTVYTDRTATNIIDAGVNEFNPDTNYHGIDRMYVGSNLSNSKAYESRVYIRFNSFPSIPKYASIDSSFLDMYHYPTMSYQSASALRVNAYMIGDFSWNSSTLKWNTQSSTIPSTWRELDQYISDKTQINSTSTNHSSDYFNITEAVRLWILGTATNNGIVLAPAAKDTAKTNRVCYTSGDTGVTAKRPQALIIYTVSTTATEGVGNGNMYYISNSNSGKYMTLEADGTQVGQAEFNGGNAQLWQITQISGNTYKVVNYGSNKWLCVNGTSNNTALPVTAKTNPNTTDVFYFRIYKSGNYHIFQPVHSASHVVSMASYSFSDGVNAVLGAHNYAAITKWKLEEAWQDGGCFEEGYTPAAQTGHFAYAMKHTGIAPLDISGLTTLDAVANRIISRANELFPDREIRRISANDYINVEKEYRIAFAYHGTSSEDISGHFVVEHSNGEWWHKDSDESAHQIINFDPADLPWDFRIEHGHPVTNQDAYYFDQGVLYFAVRVAE